jgi:hypothetical protein
MIIIIIIIMVSQLLKSERLQRKPNMQNKNQIHQEV